uniref:Uncharacterized protein n=1 Tax=Lygus hesperus TaxID=30085 RepID=A0A0A9XC81_LYGHE
MNWADESSFEGQNTREEENFPWVSGRKSSDEGSSPDVSQRFLHETDAGSLWDEAVSKSIGPLSGPPPSNIWTLRERPIHLTDSDLALSQEIFIRRCQAQDKVDFRDLLTPEMQLEAQKLLNAKLMLRSLADSWIDEHTWNQFHNYDPYQLERYDFSNTLLYPKGNGWKISHY